VTQETEMKCAFCDAEATQECDYLARNPIKTTHVVQCGEWWICEAPVCAAHSNPHRVPLGAGSAVKHLCPDHYRR
jgi:hypothetical protein